MLVGKISFPEYAGIRCLMMPYIQGESSSVPEEYRSYYPIIDSVFIKRGDMGFLTIDESVVLKGSPHRGARAKTDRPLHTEVGRLPGEIYAWGGSGGGNWGGSPKVTLDADVEILLANNLDKSCALWDAIHVDTSIDGDIGHVSHMYPYEDAVFMEAGEVHKIGIFTPHESLPVNEDFRRQFLRIVSSGVYGKEPYFTSNPLLKEA